MESIGRIHIELGIFLGISSNFDQIGQWIEVKNLENSIFWRELKDQSTNSKTTLFEYASIEKSKSKIRREKLIMKTERNIKFHNINLIYWSKLKSNCIRQKLGRKK